MPNLSVAEPADTMVQGGNSTKMPFDYKNWAPLLRKLREPQAETGIRAKDIAEEAGVSESYILSMERGDKPFGLKPLIRYLEAFDVIATRRLEALGHTLTGAKRKLELLASDNTPEHTE